MEATALSLADLKVVSEAEPRLQDIKIAEALGFGRPRDIRKIIERNMAEITRFGVCATVAQTHGPLGGRPGTEYWLNEEQALLVSTLSDFLGCRRWPRRRCDRNSEDMRMTSYIKDFVRARFLRKRVAETLRVVADYIEPDDGRRITDAVRREIMSQILGLPQ